MKRNSGLEIKAGRFADVARSERADSSYSQGLGHPHQRLSLDNRGFIDPAGPVRKYPSHTIG
jgi:hypothetical protein